MFLVINVPILIPLSKAHMCKNMFMTLRWFPLLHLCTQSNMSKSTPHSDVKQQFTCFTSKLFCCCMCNSKSTFNNKSDTTLFLAVCKKLWSPSSLFCNPAPYVLPQMRYRRLAQAHKSKYFAIENTTSKLHQSLAFLFMRQHRHTATNDSTYYTSYTMKPRLHNVQEIS
jgi:hypothetical protein